MALKVAPMGLGERSVKAFMMLFQRHYKGRITVAAPADAKVIVFNFNRERAHEEWLRLRKQYPKHGAVLLAKEDPLIRDALFVPLPIEPDHFEQSIRQAAGESPPQYRNKPAAVPVPPGAARESLAIGGNVHFKPDDYVLGHLKSTLRKNPGKALALIVANKHAIVFDPNSGMIETSLGPTGLERLASTSISERQVVTDTRVAKNLEALGKLPATPVCLALEPFLWDLAVLTAKGRVPEGTLLDQPVYLRRWPNLTRLRPIPGAVRVAALWAQQPRSLINIIVAVKVPFEHVLTFYSAATAIDLAGPAKREVDSLIVPPQVEMSEHNDLIGSILHKIGAEIRSATGRASGG